MAVAHILATATVYVGGFTAVRKGVEGGPAMTEEQWVKMWWRRVSIWMITVVMCLVLSSYIADFVYRG